MSKLKGRIPATFFVRQPRVDHNNIWLGLDTMIYIKYKAMVVLLTRYQFSIETHENYHAFQNSCLKEGME